MANAEEVAKAIVAQWGYEEAGWWEPIKQALMVAYQYGYIEGHTVCSFGKPYDLSSLEGDNVDVGEYRNENP